MLISEEVGQNTPMEHALGYLRTSSIANVGEDKDSDKRQRAAIETGAARAGYQIVDWFYDAGVSGEVEIADRTGFAEMLDRIEGNGVRTVFVESADRFARKMLTAELGIVLLISRGVTLMTAAGENLTNTDDEMRVAFRQIAMAFAQLEKTRLVKKLRGARDRRSIEAGRRIEGRRVIHGGMAPWWLWQSRWRPAAHCWLPLPLWPSVAI